MWSGISILLWDPWRVPMYYYKCHMHVVTIVSLMPSNSLVMISCLFPSYSYNCLVTWVLSCLYMVTYVLHTTVDWLLLVYSIHLLIWGLMQWQDSHFVLMYFKLQLFRGSYYYNLVPCRPVTINACCFYPYVLPWCISIKAFNFI